MREPATPIDDSSRESLSDSTGTLPEDDLADPGIARSSEILVDSGSCAGSVSPSNIDIPTVPNSTHGTPSIFESIETVPVNGPSDPLTADLMSTAVEDPSRGTSTHHPPRMSIIKRQAPPPAGDTFAGMRVPSSVSSIQRSVRFGGSNEVREFDGSEIRATSTKCASVSMKEYDGISLNRRDESEHPQQNSSAKKCDNSKALEESAKSEDQGSTLEAVWTQLQAVWSKGNREEFRFIWSHLVDWKVFEQWEQEPPDDSTSLDRRKYAAMLMVEIDSIPRDHVERVFKYNLILTTRQLGKLSEAYDSFLEATQQLRPSLGEFPLEQPTAAKVLECHNYLYGDFEKLFKELKQEDNLRGLQELRLRDGR